jgi:glycosyltransferase involved in cell wall biosynthesis
VALRRGPYDVVHTHEEAGLFGPALARLCGVPHVYDMGNDWADVLCNYGLSPRHPLTRAAAAMEDAVIARSDVVITHFPLLAVRVASSTSTPVHTVYNISLEPEPDPSVAAALRRTWVPDGGKVVLYSGTLEPYQGIMLLLKSMAEVVRTHPHARLVVMGGQRAQIDALAEHVALLGLSDAVRLIGTVPAPMVPACLMAADVLVSPRQRGRNTPLKIFSYLRSGRPIVATDIASHTQVLDEHSCVLVPPNVFGLAEGIRSVLDDGPNRDRAIVGALALQANYGIEHYVEGVAEAYAHLGGGRAPGDRIAEAAGHIRHAAAASLTDAGNQQFLGQVAGRSIGAAV